MRIVDIVPKDLAILTEFCTKDIDRLLFCLDHCEVSIDKTVQEEVDCMNYFTDTFYKTLKDLREKLSNEY